jgi:hypothetical protein
VKICQVVISTPAGLKAVADSAHAIVGAAMSAALRAKLDRRLPEVKFDGVGLSDVLDFIRDVSGLPIRVDWDGLADAGVDRNAPVTARFYDLRAGQVMRLILVGTASRDYGQFDASNWPVRESGLLGPVTIRRATK